MSVRHPWAPSVWRTSARPLVATPPPGGLVIDATSFPGTPVGVIAEIEAILGSIYVGHWG